MSTPPPPPGDDDPRGSNDPYGSPSDRPETQGEGGQTGFGLSGHGQGAYNQPAYGQPGVGAGGYGQPGYGPAGYSAPGYNAPGGPEQDNQLGVWALVTGLLGLCCGPVGIAAIILGKKSQDAAARGTATNGGLGQAGFILGIIALALMALNILLTVTGVVDYGQF